jgi:hypothetical protein
MNYEMAWVVYTPASLAGIVARQDHAIGVDYRWAEVASQSDSRAISGVGLSQEFVDSYSLAISYYFQVLMKQTPESADKPG